MTAPSYDTDLNDIFTDEIIDDWTALGGGQPGMNQETDYFIQNTSCLSKNAWASDIKGMIYDPTASITVGTDEAVLFWITHLTPNSLNNIAGGGIQALIGDSTSDYFHYYVGGSDTIEFGGWILAAVNPSQSADDTTGTTPTTWEFFGGLADLPTGGPTKGAPFGIDAIRYGRCELQCIDGEALDYATFAGANSYGDAVARRWGLLSFKDGAYYQSGLFLFGTATTAVDFRDSNRVIFIRPHPHVTAPFNTFEVRHIDSNVELTDIIFQALGTQSKGRWVTTNDADVALTNCTFIDMNTFGFESNTITLGCKFLRCGLITCNTADMTGSSVQESSVASNASALLWDVNTDPDGYLDNMEFTMGANTHHAIEFGTNVPSSFTLQGWTVSGFHVDNEEDDSVIYNNSGKALTISISSGSGTFSYKNGVDASTVMVIDPIGVAVHVSDVDGGDMDSATVYLKAKDDTGPFPFEDPVTVTNTGTSAVITGHTSHGMATNDYVHIFGADYALNNGVHQITWISTSSYSYTMTGSPGDGSAGSGITSTFVALYGTTDGNGDKSTSRAYSSNQPVEGWVRKGSDYKSFPLSGEVDSVIGYAATAVLFED